MEGGRALRRRLGLRELALLAASALTCLGVVEAALRARAPARDAFYVWPPGLRAHFRPDPELLPGVAGPSRFTINGAGIRGDAFSGSQRYRILALGGSTTESLYLDNSEAWPRLLQDELDRRLGERAFWVGNVGQSGRNTRHHVLQVRELLPQYPRIDALVLLVGINDLSRRLARDGDYRPLPQEPPEAIDALFRSAFSALPEPADARPPLAPVETLRRLRTLAARLRPAAAEALGPEQDVTGAAYARWRRHRREAAVLRARLPDLASALEEYRHNLHAIAEFAERAGARVVFATQPTLWAPQLAPELERLLWMGGVGRFQREPGHAYYGVEALAEGMARYNRVLLDVCRERGVECVDLARALPSDTRVFYDDCHFNESGARRVAALLADYLWRRSDFQTASTAGAVASVRRRGR